MGKWLQTLLFHPMLDEQTAGFRQKKDEETIPNKYIYSLQTRQTKDNNNNNNNNNQQTGNNKQTNQQADRR